MDPINIRGKGVILITVGYKAFISWVRERREEEDKNKVRTGTAAWAKKVTEQNTHKSDTKLQIPLVCFSLISHLTCCHTGRLNEKNMTFFLFLFYNL